ncbi:adenylate kinase family protein [Candidatus Bathyarchaeota archaeon]|nr:adenylate kinase family protein [Candidatus Bathyarchaeota archaeon]
MTLYERGTILSRCDSNLKNKRIILITGTPCVGKTSVSKELSTKINALHIDLAELVKKERLYSEVDQERGSLVADMEKVSKRVEEIVEKSKIDVVIDGHYSVYIVNPKNIDFVFVLRKNPKKLKTLMEKRGYSGKKLWENLAAEILDVCLSEAIEICGENRVCEIDTTEKTVEEVVNEVLRIIEGKNKCRVGIVDWLGKLEQEGSLEDFLRNF